MIYEGPSHSAIRAKLSSCLAACICVWKGDIRQVRGPVCPAVCPVGRVMVWFTVSGPHSWDRCSIQMYVSFMGSCPGLCPYSDRPQKPQAFSFARSWFHSSLLFVYWVSPLLMGYSWEGKWNSTCMWSCSSGLFFHSKHCENVHHDIIKLLVASDVKSNLKYYYICNDLNK